MCVVSMQHHVELFVCISVDIYCVFMNYRLYTHTQITHITDETFDFKPEEFTNLGIVYTYRRFVFGVIQVTCAPVNITIEISNH